MTKTRSRMSSERLVTITVVLCVAAFLLSVAAVALQSISHTIQLHGTVATTPVTLEEGDAFTMNCPTHVTSTDEHAACDFSEILPQGYSMLQFSTYNTATPLEEFTSDMRVLRGLAGARFNYDGSRHFGEWKQVLPGSDPPFGVNEYLPSVVLDCVYDGESGLQLVCSSQEESPLTHSWKFEFDLQDDYMYFYAEVDSSVSIETQVLSTGETLGDHFNIA